MLPRIVVSFSENDFGFDRWPVGPNHQATCDLKWCWHSLSSLLILSQGPILGLSLHPLKPWALLRYLAQIRLLPLGGSAVCGHPPRGFVHGLSSLNLEASCPSRVPKGPLVSFKSPVCGKLMTTPSSENCQFFWRSLWGLPLPYSE